MTLASIHKRFIGAAGQNPTKHKADSARPDLEDMTLDELFEVAEGYGYPRIFKSDVVTAEPWHAKITFNTIAGASLAADRWATSARSALAGAIRNAEVIRGQFK